MNPLTSTLFSAAMAIAVAPVTNTGGSPTVGPTARPSAAQPTHAVEKKSARKPKPDQVEHVLRPVQRPRLVKKARNRRATRALASALVRLADGERSSKVDRRIGKHVGRSKRKRAAARRLVDRIANAKPKAMQRVLGDTSIPHAASRPKARGILADWSGLALHDLRPTIPLPAEQVAKPTTYALVSTGIQSLAAHDADGTDELSGVVIFATEENGTYTLQAVPMTSRGAVEVAEGTAAPIGTTLRDDKHAHMLVVTGLVEDDGGDVAEALAEIEVLVDLAAGVAETLDGQDRLAVLQAMIDYTVGLHELADANPGAPSSISALRMDIQEWFALYGVDPTRTQGIDWKIAVPHSLGSGEYEVLMSIPSTLPDMATVRVAVDRFWLVPPTALAADQFYIQLGIGIGQKSADYDLPVGVFDKSSIVVVERKVIRRAVTISLRADARSTSDGFLTGGLSYPLFDLAPGSDEIRKFRYALDGKQKKRLTTKGDAAERLKGGMTVTVTHHD